MDPRKVYHSTSCQRANCETASLSEALALVVVGRDNLEVCHRADLSFTPGGESWVMWEPRQAMKSITLARKCQNSDCVLLLVHGWRSEPHYCRSDLSVIYPIIPDGHLNVDSVTWTSCFSCIISKQHSCCLVYMQRGKQVFNTSTFFLIKRICNVAAHIKLDQMLVLTQ